MAAFPALLMGSLYRYARVIRFLLYGMVGAGISLLLGMLGLPAAVSMHLVLMSLGLLFVLFGLPRLVRLRHLPESSHDG